MIAYEYRQVILSWEDTIWNVYDDVEPTVYFNSINECLNHIGKDGWVVRTFIKIDGSKYEYLFIRKIS